MSTLLYDDIQVPDSQPDLLVAQSRVIMAAHDEDRLGGAKIILDKTLEQQTQEDVQLLVAAQTQRTPVGDSIHEQIARRKKDRAKRGWRSGMQEKQNKSKRGAAVYVTDGDKGGRGNNKQGLTGFINGLLRRKANKKGIEPEPYSMRTRAPPVTQQPVNKAQYALLLEHRQNMMTFRRRGNHR